MNAKVFFLAMLLFSSTLNAKINTGKYLCDLDAGQVVLEVKEEGFSTNLIGEKADVFYDKKNQNKWSKTTTGISKKFRYKYIAEIGQSNEVITAKIFSEEMNLSSIDVIEKLEMIITFLKISDTSIHLSLILDIENMSTGEKTHLMHLGMCNLK